MSLPYLETDFGCWSPEGQPLRIEFAIPVLEEIAALAVDGQYRFRHGGVEIGGVLFGQIEDDVVRITAHRPLACEHAFGPRFVLSDRDRYTLRNLLQAPKHDGALTGLEVVGWYHSHTRSEIALSPRDLEVYDTFFPQPREVALIIRPEHFGPVRMGFFFRESDGSIRTQSSYEELIVRPRRHHLNDSDPEEGGEPERDADADPDYDASLPPDGEDQQTVEASEEASPDAESGEECTAPPAAELPAAALPSFAQAQPQSSRKTVWLVLALVLAGATGFGIERYYRLSPGQSPLSLWVADMGGQLLIEWDRSAKAVRNARNGTLDILDGKDRVKIYIDGVHLREGSVDYVRRSEIVDVRLRVDGGRGTAEEFIRFVGPPVQRPGAADGELARRRDELQAEVDNLKNQLSLRDAQIQKLRRQLTPTRK